MKIKMMTDSGEVVIDANKVTQFYAHSSGDKTVVETLDDSSKSQHIVNYDFYIVTHALVAAWGAEKIFSTEVKN